jgi:hypothetical protein
VHLASRVLRRTRARQLTVARLQSDVNFVVYPQHRCSSSAKFAASMPPLWFTPVFTVLQVLASALLLLQQSIDVGIIVAHADVFVVVAAAGGGGCLECRQALQVPLLRHRGQRHHHPTSSSLRVVRGKRHAPGEPPAFDHVSSGHEHGRRCGVFSAMQDVAHLTTRLEDTISHSAGFVATTTSTSRAVVAASVVVQRRGVAVVGTNNFVTAAATITTTTDDEDAAGLFAVPGAFDLSPGHCSPLLARFRAYRHNVTG